MESDGEPVVDLAELSGMQGDPDTHPWTSAPRPRVLLYSQDGLGLGHLRRTSSLANELLRLRPQAAVLTVSDSPLGTFFGTAPNHDYLKLPSLVKSGPHWHALSLPLPSDDLLALRRDILRTTALNFRPDLLLVDHMPHGAGGELLATLEALAFTSTKVVLGLRDILDTPEVIRHRWEAEGAYEAVERYYDRVLVYGSKDVFDVAEQYGLSTAGASRLRYCGYVCTPDRPQRAARIRGRCLNGNGKARLIVAMAGGGADAYPMMDSLLRALPTIQAEIPCSLVMITGPFMPPAVRRDLMVRAQGVASVRTSVSDVLSYIGAADLVVCMAGYNTTTEVLQLGKPAVLVPRRGPSAEQRTRARLFAARDWVGVVDPVDLSAATLSAAVLARFGGAGARPTASPDFGGLQRAAEHLTRVLDGPRRDVVGDTGYAQEPARPLVPAAPGLGSFSFP